MVEKSTEFPKTDSVTLELIINKLKEINITIIDPSELTRHNLISEGGFGKVYKGLYKDIFVAIKELFLLVKPESINEVVNEIQVIEKADHKRLPIFYGVSITNDSSFSLVFEFIDGKDYKLAYKDMSKQDNISAMVQLCEIVDSMHKRKLIHRDLKPGNTIIQENNVVRLIDFGTTKIASRTLTFTKKSIGTVNYMAPENYDIDVDDEMNENPISISPKTDVWSIGCMLCEIFSGVTPWTNKFKSVKSIESHLILKKKFPIPKELQDPSLLKIINMCLYIDPEDRAELKDVIAELNALLDEKNE